MTRVLVVDDEIDTLNLLRTILEISGYQAFTTLNSVDAITLAEIEHPDCILLDIMMPQLDGFTLCKMMRLHPATMHLPIVFVTAYSALDLEDRRREAGADMVLPKPVGMDVLIRTVEEATQLRKNKPAPVPAAPPITPAPANMEPTRPSGSPSTPDSK
ncbi:MAG: response regulator [Anaerolineae bacterium]|nr:response regulator [Anaerolineae bacterium]